MQEKRRVLFPPVPSVLPRSSVKCADSNPPRYSCHRSLFLTHVFLTFFLPFFFFLPFIDPRIVSASPLDCGLPSCLLSLIQALNFHSGSLTHEVKLNYSHYLAVSLHTHSLFSALLTPQAVPDTKVPHCLLCILASGKWVLVRSACRHFG